MSEKPVKKAALVMWLGPFPQVKVSNGKCMQAKIQLYSTQTLTFSCSVNETFTDNEFCKAMLASILL